MAGASEQYTNIFHVVTSRFAAIEQFRELTVRGIAAESGRVAAANEDFIARISRDSEFNGLFKDKNKLLKSLGDKDAISRLMLV